MPHVAFLPSSPRAAARLRAALADDHTLLRIPDWPGLLATLREQEVSACIVDVDYPHRRIGVGELEMIRREHPGIALVVYGVFRESSLELFHLGRLGIDELILADKDDHPRKIRSTVSRALARALAFRVEDRLDGQLSEIGLRCLRWAIEHAHEAPLVPDLADALRTTRRTLSRSLRRGGMPPPGRFLLWGRLFRAAQLLEDPEVTVEGAAYRMGYSSAAALRRALVRETGLPPTGVSDRGGVLWVLDSFIRSSLQRRSSRERLRWGRSRSRKKVGDALLDPYG